jgi:hypothetical protein
MNFNARDRVDIRSHLEVFGEKIIYKGVEITAIVDYAGETINGKGQRDVATITVSKEDIVKPLRGDSVILPDAGTYSVEDGFLSDVNIWSIRLRDNEKSGLGRVR